jgi:hypothetical protein
VWERQEIPTKFLMGNLTGRDHAEDIGIGGKLILEWLLGS